MSEEYDPRKGQCRYPGCAARTFKVFCENHGGPDPEELTTALDQLEKVKKALRIIRDFPCIINRTGETHSMKYIAFSTLKELEK
jgi:hypothetical protein